MVKSYLRYEARRPFGVVASATAQCLFDASGRLAIVPALENVLVWNLRTG
jgi:U3 small nucleolar RNA-associated protein 12